MASKKPSFCTSQVATHVIDAAPIAARHPVQVLQVDAGVAWMHKHYADLELMPRPRTP